ncbi:MAG: YjbE family putative metal transport protein [Ferrovibrio sp.]|uniref:TerC family protein n=1 Tax=Ferrovibrio sp. TaxID=1917215 RepID=UPI00262CAFD0|nr:TerC family protein [Ferrovibrio sp.]MCW0233336.1 YjbE family putative metal transport protein [Ferrovibrio sp.]
MDITLFGLTITAAELSAFAQVILIDVILSGDNAIVIGMAVAGLPAAQRNKIIVYGILAATVLRILFASVAVQLLQIIGLTLAGGILLLWVAWKMWRELREQAKAAKAGENGEAKEKPAPKTQREAVMQIIVADLSMSIDNVLAVAGAAREHPYILGFGLVLSIALMAVASKAIARLLDRFHWIAYIGLIIIAYVALKMIWDGGLQVAPFIPALNGG